MPLLPPVISAVLFASLISISCYQILDYCYNPDTDLEFLMVIWLQFLFKGDAWGIPERKKRRPISASFLSLQRDSARTPGRCRCLGRSPGYLRIAGQRVLKRDTSQASAHGVPCRRFDRRHFTERQEDSRARHPEYSR